MDRSAESLRLSYRAMEGTNTKTRRLAYLTAILTALKGDGIGERLLLARLARWSQGHRDDLHSYWVRTGEVTSTRRNSSGARYLHLATQLAIIVPIAGAYRITRTGRVLLALTEHCPINDNPFFLSPAEQLYYTYLLLEKDADVLLTITDHLLNQPGISLAQLQRTFKTDFLARLDQKMARIADERLKQSLFQRQVEVKTWTKPERYAEHLVPPRLNWLLDLGFLDTSKFKTHRCEITPAGQQFLATLLHPDGDGFSDVTHKWLNSVYWEVAMENLLRNQVLVGWDEVDKTFRQSILKVLLKEAFQAFRYTLVPKVTLAQAFLYLCSRLALEHRIKVSPALLREWFSLPQVLDGQHYEVRFSPRENESYLLATAM